MLPSRPSLRHSSPLTCSSFLDRLLDRLSSCLTIRTFVILLGISILLVNFLMLFSLSPNSSYSLEHRPNGGPIEGSEVIAHHDGRGGIDAVAAERRASLIKTRYERIKTPAEEPTTITTPPTIPSSTEGKSRISLWQKPTIEPCDHQFGNGFSMATEMCDGGEQETAAIRTTTLSAPKPRITCHRNHRHNGVWCDSSSIVLDVTQLDVAHGGEKIESVRGRDEAREFIRYSQGAWKIGCKSAGTEVAKELFPHHLEDIFRSLDYLPETTTHASAQAQCEMTITEPTFFVTRYEYANMYHSMGDFYNTYQTIYMSGIDLDRDAFRIVFLDGHSAGALDEIWTKVFTKNVMYVSELTEKEAKLPNGKQPTKFCFSRGIFVSPAYKGSISVEMMSDNPCHERQECLADFAKGMLRRYGVEDVNPWDLLPEKDLFEQEVLPKNVDLTKTPLVTMIFRKDYLAHPRLASLHASRKVSNEDEIGATLKALSASGKAHAIGMDFAKLSVLQQLMLVRYSTLLVGIHGAGLSTSLFLSSTSSPKTTGALFELVPPEYSGRPHFRFFADWSHLRYASMQVGGEDGNGHHVEKQGFQSIVNDITQERCVEPPEGWKRNRPTTAAASKDTS